MRAAFATVTEEEGVVATAATVNGFTLAELQFPSGYVQPEFEPDLPYLALVLDGTLEKRFGARRLELAPASGVTMPAGAAHSARFGATGARIVIVKVRRPAGAVPAHLERLSTVRAPGLEWIGRRLAAELRTPDAAAPLAAEGFALELLAASSRETSPRRTRVRPPVWLVSAEELLRSRSRDCVCLSELAAAVGVCPTHLAREFRRHYGLAVGEYGRRLRLGWAAAELARTDTPVAAIAVAAGFADQSHFTRLFKRHVGTTPARYRAATRPMVGPFQRS